MKLQLMSDENEALREIDLPSGSSFAVIYNGAYGVACDCAEVEYIKFDDKHVLRQSYMKQASELCSKYSQYLYNVYPYQIAFVVDEEWIPSEKASKNSAWKIEIAKAPAWLRMTMGYEYMIKMRQHWLDKWSEAQLAAAIMSQLLRINPEDGNIFKYTEDFQSKFVATFGIGYLEPNTVIPNLLTEDVRIIGFKEASGQISIDELPVQESKTDHACGECLHWYKQSTGMGVCGSAVAVGIVADSHPACNQFDLQVPAESENDQVESENDRVKSENEPDTCEIEDGGDDE